MTRRPGPPPRAIVLEADASGGCFLKGAALFALGWLALLVVRSFATGDLIGVVAALVIGPVMAVFAMSYADRYPLWIALDGDRLVWRYALQDERSTAVSEVTTLDRSFLSNEATITFRDGTELRSGNTIGFPGLADAIVRANPDAQILYGTTAW